MYQTNYFLHKKKKKQNKTTVITTMENLRERLETKLILESKVEGPKRDEEEYMYV